MRWSRESVAHVSHGLIEHARDLMQTGQVVLVILLTLRKGESKASEAYPR